MAEPGWRPRPPPHHRRHPPRSPRGALPAAPAPAPGPPVVVSSPSAPPSRPGRPAPAGPIALVPMDRRTDTCRWVRARAGLGSKRARGLFVCVRTRRDPQSPSFVCWGQRGGRALGAEEFASAEPGARWFAARSVSEGTVPAPVSSSRAGGREGGGMVCPASC